SLLVSAPTTRRGSVQATAKIAFDSNRDGNFEIYVMNADGSGQRRLTRNPAKDVSPAWSPDGRRIAFARDRGSTKPSSDIYVMNADGSRLRRLTRSPANDVSPAWSPNGRKIVFVSDRDNYSYDNNIWVMN